MESITEEVNESQPNTLLCTLHELIHLSYIYILERDIIARAQYNCFGYEQEVPGLWSMWIYGQWQPLYAEMQRITPGIESVKGIPANIEDEQFLNPDIQNLIVIDDLMSEATNDKRICELFTKVLHHCNLSVICLVQNYITWGKKVAP